MNLSYGHKASHCSYVLGPFRGDYGIFQRTPRLFLLGIARPRLCSLANLKAFSLFLALALSSSLLGPLPSLARRPVYYRGLVYTVVLKVALDRGLIMGPLLNT